MITINSVNIKKLSNKFDLTVCKVNKQPLAEIPTRFIESITRSLSDFDTINLTIPYYTIDSETNESIKNPIYDEIKSERLLCLNDEEYFVIKESKRKRKDRGKEITAYSREYKLGKLDISVEDIGFQLIGKDEKKKIYSLNDHMKKETGWSFGYIDDSVRFNISNGEKTEKLRWQESISMRWYDFLVKNVSEAWGCIATFDTKDKLVNLYDINTMGEEVQMYLSYDNYLKDLGVTDASSDIVTRMYITGNEEMDIIGATPTGYPYLENFSYFIENEEMSSELIHAIITYESRVVEHNIEWKRLSSLKVDKTVTLASKQNDILRVYEEISAQEGLVKVYDSRKDEVNKAIALAKITELNDVKVKLEQEIMKLEEEIASLTSSIKELNKLCKRETATDINGSLIFNEHLLDELKEFVYCETYTNDSFLRVEDLVEAGERELELKCRPSETYTLDVVNFINRIKDPTFRQHWDGELSLGNVIMLKDDNYEVLQYFTGFTISPNKEDGLSLTISNKKVKESNIRIITDKVQEASRSMVILNTKKYLWNKQKYNRLNL